MADSLKDIKDRLSRIEAFLDMQWGERQQFTSTASPYTHGVFDTGHGLPVVVSPTRSQCPAGGTQIPVRDAAIGGSIAQSNSVQDVEAKAVGIVPPEGDSIIEMEKGEGAIQSRRTVTTNSQSR